METGLVGMSEHDELLQIFSSMSLQLKSAFLLCVAKLSHDFLFRSWKFFAWKLSGCLACAWCRVCRVWQSGCLSLLLTATSHHPASRPHHADVLTSWRCCTWANALAASVLNGALTTDVVRGLPHKIFTFHLHSRNVLCFKEVFPFALIIIILWAMPDGCRLWVGLINPQEINDMKPEG